MTLLKREKDLFLKIRPAYVHSPEMEEVARIFHLTPGLSKYRIKSELSEEADREIPEPAGERHDLPEHEVGPPDHDLPLQGCVRPRGARAVGGRADDARARTGGPSTGRGSPPGTSSSHSRKHRPRDAEVAVQYRGYWFYIDRSDVNSRAILAILEILFALQESDGKTAGPLLTLPLGG